MEKTTIIDYPEMAIELRDKIKKCTTEESDTGITFVEKEQPIFND